MKCVWKKFDPPNGCPSLPSCAAGSESRFGGFTRAFASEWIAEAVVAMEYKASNEDLQRIVHAHPTISESLREAALSVHGRALHL